MLTFKERKILIISYTFPPQGGVGGRRWAKFVKYFVRAGIDVQVIASEPLNHTSIWQEDIASFTNRITYLPSSTGKILRTVPVGIAEKLRYRVTLLRNKILHKGNYYDWSIDWNNQLLPEVERLIAEGYTTIIASGGPFSYLYDLSSLRAKYGASLKLIADFRDPWTENRTAFGYDQISGKRFQFEKHKEQTVIERFDAVVTVADEMTEYFKTHDVGQSTHFQTLINGFDQDDYASLIPKRSEDLLHLVFVGTLYHKTIDHVKAFCSALNHLAPQLSDQVKIHFYGEMHPDARQLLQQLSFVVLHGSVPREAAQQALCNADMAMLFLTDDLTYSFSTKFCEYIAFELPIWVISEQGKTPDVIVENRIGIHSLPEVKSIQKGIDEVLTFNQGENETGYTLFDKTPFDLQSIAEDYLKLLTKIS